MTKVSGTFDFTSFTTDAKFRSWGSTMSAALASAGFVKTSDTGQIDWATVTKPVATNTTAGYEVWRFNDSLQSTKPIFMGIVYGSAAVASGNSVRIAVTVGTGSNGSGTITGPTVSATLGSSSTNGYNNAASPYMFTHSTSRGYGFMNFGHGVSGSDGLAMWMVIERTKDATGAVTSNGVSFAHQSAATAAAPREMSINFDTNTAFGTSRSLHCGFLSTAYSLTSGSSLAVYRHYTNPGFPYYTIGRLGYYAADVVVNTTFTATPVGATSHTFYALAGVVNAGSANNASEMLAVLWED